MQQGQRQKGQKPTEPLEKINRVNENVPETYRTVKIPFLRLQYGINTISMTYSLPSAISWNQSQKKGSNKTLLLINEITDNKRTDI